MHKNKKYGIIISYYLKKKKQMRLRNNDQSVINKN